MSTSTTTSSRALSFTVLGATGQVGGRTARQLLAAGHKVRAIVRNQASPASQELQELGAQLFEVRSSDPSPYATNEARLSLALSGVDGAFLLIPPHLTTPQPDKDAAKYVDILKRAVKASGVKKVVLLSGIGAQHATGTGVSEKLYYLEQEFSDLAKSSDITVVAIRAGYFFTNIQGSLKAVAAGFFPGSVQNGDKKVNFTSIEDIGDEAAKQLSDGSTHNGSLRFIELAGPEDLTFNEVAQLISEIVGKEIKYVATPKEAQQAQYEGYGLSPAGARQVVLLASGVDDGKIGFEDNSSLVRGTHQIHGFLRSQLNH